MRSLLPRFTLLSLTAVLSTLLGTAPANANFHLNEITKVIVGVNGNTTVQAVEFKMLAAGENLLAGAQINVYNAAGTFVTTLGTFPGSVPTGLTNRRILCTTENFRVAFGIEPDLIINPGLLVGTGQVVFEKPGVCVINGLAYGAVTTPINGTTSAAALGSTGATFLVRSVDDGIVISCPLDENASARFGLVNATAASPVNVINNFGDIVQVYPTAAGVDGSPGVPVAPVRVYPNPFSHGAKIVAPGYGVLTVYDINGRLVRRWGSPGARPAVIGGQRLDWDGTDHHGRRLASGIYFVQYGFDRQNRARVVLLR
jgi:hypothetical protein